MCGGCGRSDFGDWLTPAVSSAQARDLASRTVSTLVPGSLRVAAAGSGFVVRFPTGRTAVVPTLTAVWAEVFGHGATAPLEPPDRAAAPDPPTWTAAETPGGRLAVAVVERKQTVDRLAAEWNATAVTWCAPRTSLEELVVASSTARLLLAVHPQDLSACLRLVTHRVVGLRTAVTAVVHEGTGPSWATDIRRPTAGPLHAVLAGASPAATVHHDLRLPEAAAWLAGLVASGRTRDRRVTWSVEGGHWILDAADGRGLAIRPASG